MHFRSLLSFTAFAVLCASCASEDEPIPVTKTGDMVKPRLVGRVASVPSDKRFILIQSYGNWNVTSGTVLVSHGTDGRTANLLATGEVMGQYAAADIQAGDVIVGDSVYSRELIKSSTAEPQKPVVSPQSNTSTSAATATKPSP